MAVQRTFSIIKPDATERNLTGAVNAVIEKAGLRIIGQRRIKMTQEQAERFYAVHSERPFFGELVEFMTSGPVVVPGSGRRKRRREIPRSHGRHESGRRR
jgi:nucleoside-diphosphate kinase